MNVVIHIGTHKTGSTAIQHFLHHNQQHLRDRGYLYPASGIQKAHHQIAWALRSRLHRNISEAVKRETIMGLTRYIESRDYHTVILSSEEFEFAKTPADFAVMQSALHDCQVRIIVYLRWQDEYFESEYNQHVKMYETRYSGTIYDFYIKHNFHGRFDYLKLLEPWERAFGRDKIQVRPFEAEQFVNANLLDDIVHTLGIPGDLALEMPPRLDSNKSLSAAACFLLARANSRQLDPASHGRLVRLLYDYDGNAIPKFPRFLSSRNAFDIASRFEASNREVARRYLRRVDGVLFKTCESSKGRRSVSNTDIREECLEHLLSLLIELSQDMYPDGQVGKAQND